MKKTFTREEAVKYLQQKQGDMTVEAFAQKLNISAVQLRAVYRGIRFPGRKTGFRKVAASIVYERIDG
jgi:hypothetical protein